MIPFRKRPSLRTLLDEQKIMADAIVEVLTRGGLTYYDQLSDDQVLGFSNMLWEFHCDLRDEWSRREMQKAADAK